MLWLCKHCAILLSWHSQHDMAFSWPKTYLSDMQVQAELGPGHINLINVYELILSDDYLGLVMEYAQGGSLTAHVAERWGIATPGKLVMDEDEARYFFRVINSTSLCFSKSDVQCQWLACSAAMDSKVCFVMSMLSAAS